METAFALEKLFPKQCQILGIVTPGIVGERKYQLDFLPCIYVGSYRLVNYLQLKKTFMFLATQNTVKVFIFTMVFCLTYINVP